MVPNEHSREPHSEVLTVLLPQFRGEYNKVRLNAAIGYVTLTTSITAAAPPSPAREAPARAQASAARRKGQLDLRIDSEPGKESRPQGVWRVSDPN